MNFTLKVRVDTLDEIVKEAIGEAYDNIINTDYDQRFINRELQSAGSTIVIEAIKQGVLEHE